MEFNNKIVNLYFYVIFLSAMYKIENILFNRVYFLLVNIKNIAKLQNVNKSSDIFTRFCIRKKNKLHSQKILKYFDCLFSFLR